VWSATIGAEPLAAQIADARKREAVMDHQQATAIDPPALGRQHDQGAFRGQYERTFNNSPWWQVGVIAFGDGFGMAAEAAVAACQHPSVQAAYRSGQTSHFGRLSISSRGLYDGERSAWLAWQDLEGIKISTDGTVSIKRRGKKCDWASFPMGKLTNLAALRRLLTTDAPPTFSFTSHVSIL
jgi:hypothetical protein